MSSIAASDQLALDVESAMAPGFVTCPPCAPVVDVAALMSVHQIHAVVVDPGQPRLVTALDVVRAALAGSAGVAEVTQKAPTAATTDTLSTVAARMVAERAPHVLVHEHDSDHACGIVSSFDVAAVLAGHQPRLARIVRPAAARPAISTSRLDKHQVREAMHRGVIACPPGASLVDVAGALVERRAHTVVVFDGAAPRFISDLDLLAAALRGDPPPTAQDIAGTRAPTVGTGERLDAVAQLLVETPVGHAVVLDAESFPVGVVSLLDIVGVLAVG
jgi:CBS domain-containing protein